MKSAIYQERFVVAINHDEACRVANGGIVGDRVNPIVSDAKVVVRSLDTIDQLYEPLAETEFMSGEHVKRINTLASRAIIYYGMDVTIYVPREVVRTAFIASEHIPLDAVEVFDQDFEPMKASMPEDGIEIRFDNGIGSGAFSDYS